MKIKILVLSVAVAVLGLAFTVGATPITPVKKDAPQVLVVSPVVPPTPAQLQAHQDAIKAQIIKAKAKRAAVHAVKAPVTPKVLKVKAPVKKAKK